MLWSEFEARHGRLRQAGASAGALLRRLAVEGQHPQVLWIGCCDARVAPEQIVGAGPGELFVLRNIANLVPPADGRDDSVGAALEYAVQHLGVAHVVVCGHTHCGGIAALLAHADTAHEPHVARWLAGASEAVTRAAAYAPPAERALAAERANVVLQLERLRQHPCVRSAEACGALALHGWLFDLAEDALWAYDEALQRWAPLD